MIDLQIGGLFIDADSNQHTLGKPIKRKVKDKEGRETEQDRFDAYGYYPSLCTALYGAYKVLVREFTHNSTMTIKEAIQRCEELGGI